MAKFQEKIKVQHLRKKGLSIKVISEKLGLSKSTVSLWCRDIVLTKDQKSRLIEQMIKGGHKGRLLGAESNRQKKLKVINNAYVQAKNLIGVISDRDLFILGIGLFWGEGSKTGSRFVFINSDMSMIKLMKEFLIKVMKVDSDLIRITVQINYIHKPRIDKVIKFWSKQLNLPKSQFDNPYYVKVAPKKVYANYKIYNGIVRLRVLRGSNLQYKMLGLVNILKNKYAGVAQVVRARES